MIEEFRLAGVAGQSASDDVLGEQSIIGNDAQIVHGEERSRQAFGPAPTNPFAPIAGLIQPIQHSKMLQEKVFSPAVMEKSG